MSEMNINAAMTKLGITRTEAKALDNMDGKQNEKIGQSVFDQAEAILSTAKKAQSEDDLKGVLLNTPVAKAISKTLNKILGELKNKAPQQEATKDKEVPEEVTTQEEEPNTANVGEENTTEDV